MDEALKRRLIGIAGQSGSDFARTQPQQKQGGFESSSLIAEGGGLGGAVAGGIAGATIGSAVPVVGTAIGGLVGAGLGGFLGGTGGSIAEQKIRDNNVDFGEALKFGAVEGITSAGPIKLLRGAKAANAALKAGQSVSPAVTKAVNNSLLRNLSSRAASNVRSRAAGSILKASPTAFERASDAGFDLTTSFRKWAPTLGKSFDEIVGPAGKSSRGNINKTIASLEDGITKVTNQAGRTVRLSGEDIIKDLKSELRILKPKLGSSNKVKQLEALIEEATKKYKNGLPTGKARQLLKTANREFGKSIVDTTGDAVIKSAQKVEANAIRNSLKRLFPQIGSALDNEAELLTLREVLKRAAATSRRTGFNFTSNKGILGIPEKLLNTEAVSGRIAASQPRQSLLGRVNTVPTRAVAGSLIGRDGEGQPSTPSSLLQDGATGSPLGGGLGGSPLGGAPQPQQGSAEFYRAGAKRALAAGDIDSAKGLMERAELAAELSPESAGPNVGKVSAQQFSLVQSGLTGVSQLKQMLQQDPGVISRARAPGRGIGLLGIGGTISNVAGTAKFDAIGYNIADALLRLSTGAAANESEINNLRTKIMPRAGDRAETVQFKLQQIEQRLLPFAELSNQNGLTSNTDDLLSQLNRGGN